MALPADVIRLWLGLRACHLPPWGALCEAVSSPGSSLSHLKWACFPGLVHNPEVCLWKCCLRRGARSRCETGDGEDGVCIVCRDPPWLFAFLNAFVHDSLYLHNSPKKTLVHAMSPQSCPTLCFCGPSTARLLCPWDSPGKNRRWLLRPPPGDLPHPEIKPMSLTSPALSGKFFTTSATWKILKRP